MAAGTIRVTIDRSDAAAQRDFEVVRTNVHVVLDLVVAASRLDPSVAYRYSCRSGFCGTCTLLLDGVPVLACETPVPSSGRAHLAPLGGFPVLRDLVVDTGPFAERWDAIAPAFAPVAPVDLAPMSIAAPRSAPAVTPSTAVTDSLDCISCGACFAACDVSSAGSLFLGPAALTRAMILAADPRDRADRKRLELVGGPQGIDGCHGIGACSLVCPRALDPARAIRRLRRRRVASSA